MGSFAREVSVLSGGERERVAIRAHRIVCQCGPLPWLHRHGSTAGQACQDENTKKGNDEGFASSVHGCGGLFSFSIDSIFRRNSASVVLP